MEKVCFFDLNNDGHHWFYNYTLMSSINKIYKVYYYTSKLSEEMIEVLLRKNIKFNIVKFKDKSKLIRYIYELKNIFKIIRYCKKNDIKKLVVMHLDSNILWCYLFYWLFRLNKIKVIGVEHWFPNNKLKIRIYKILSERITIIVHTKDIFDKTIKLNKKVKNLNLINYPVTNVEFIDSKTAKLKLGINNNNFTLLYFGGTRIDKGIDILINALKYFNEEINLVIAGKEEHFKKDYIVTELNKYNNINLILNLKFIRENDIKYYFNACDCVVIPYKKYFNGESGIFTEAINYGKALIVPDIIHFPKILDNEQNGVIFKVENYKDLAEKLFIMKKNIYYFKKNAIKYQKIYREEHSIENFVNGYKRVLRG